MFHFVRQKSFAWHACMHSARRGAGRQPRGCRAVARSLAPSASHTETAHRHARRQAAGRVAARQPEAAAPSRRRPDACVVETTLLLGLGGVLVRQVSQRAKSAITALTKGIVSRCGQGTRVLVDDLPLMWFKGSMPPQGSCPPARVPCAGRARGKFATSRAPPEGNARPRVVRERVYM